MILLDEDLEKYLGPTYREDIQKLRDSNQIYSGINVRRNEFFKKKYSDINEHVAEAEAVHKIAQ